jgi:superfamily II DNA/RNA helicase
LTFADLHLSDALLKAVADSGYDEPTAIQAAAIPQVLMGRDLIGVAQTGTGKTASFVLPMIDILAEGRSRARMPRSLILEPTRELAAQVAENFEKYGKYHKLSMALLIGGVAFGDQDRALEKGVDVLIATPGRLMDQHARGKILLSGVDVLVIDEADRMLDMGFIPDVEKICTYLKPQRQTLLFSATMPGPIRKLADQFMTNPRTVEVSRPATTNADIAQSVYMVSERGKREALGVLLRNAEMRTAIIFCNRKTTVRDLADYLKRAGFKSGQIHGDMEQADRIRELDRFKAGDINILVASDVAARGLDIKGVSHVFNHDVPWHPDDYVHRIGRTGRAGRTGISITLATNADAEALDRIQALIGQKIARHEGGVAEDASASAAPAAAPRGRRAPAARRQPAAAEAPPAATAQPAANGAPGDVAEQATAQADARPARAPRRRREGRPAAAATEMATEAVASADAAPAPVSARRPRGEKPPERIADRPERSAERPAERRPEQSLQQPAGRSSQTRAPRNTDRRPERRDDRAERGERADRNTRASRDDLGPSFTGFGDEGVPAFLQVPARG